MMAQSYHNNNNQVINNVMVKTTTVLSGACCNSAVAVKAAGTDSGTTVTLGAGQLGVCADIFGK